MLLSALASNNAGAQINYTWAKSIHSTAPNPDLGKGVVVDNAGNVYVTGQYGFSSNPGADFNPFGTNGYDGHLVNSNGGYDNFFAKYGADGNCIWAKSLDLGVLPPVIGILSISVDAAQNVYVAGVFEGTADFDPDAPIYPLVSAGGADCFFAKYDLNGHFIWAKRFGSTGNDAGMGIAVIPSDSVVYVTGFSEGTSPTFSDLAGIDYSLANTAVGKDIFLAKYLSNGSFKWVNVISGSGEDIAAAIDASDSYVAITGSFQGFGVDFGQGSTLDANGFKSAFIAKYHDDGSYGWGYSLGDNNISNNTAIGTGVAIDGSYIYVTGVFKGTMVLPDVGSSAAVTLNATGGQDVFFAKYQISQILDFANQIGGSSQTDSVMSYSMVVDPSTNIYLTGALKGSVNFNTTTGSVVNNLTSAGDADIFFAKYDGGGFEKWAKRMGSIKADIGYGIAVDNSENVYLTGSFGDTVDFDPGQGIATRICSDPNNLDKADIFIAKYREGTSTITGLVTRSSGSIVAHGYVSLYTQTIGDGNAAMHLADTTMIEINGGYTFKNVCTGNYKVLAVANHAVYSLAAPTYFGDTTHWEGAFVVTTTANDTSFANIEILEDDLNFLTGNAILSGTVWEGDGYGRGVGIPAVPIGLEGDPGSIKAHTSTDADGHYSFAGVPLGDYKIYVNIPGLPMDSTYRVHVTIADTSIIDLNFVADSSSIDTIPKGLTSVAQASASIIKMKVYPNPYKGSTAIEFALLATNNVQIEVYNLLGENVAELLNEQKQAGIVKCRFNVVEYGLKSGIYLLKLKIGDEVSTMKMVQME